MKNKMLLLAMVSVLTGCGSSNDNFITTPQKEVTYTSFEDCKKDLSIIQCQSAIDNQQKQQNKSDVGFANRDATTNNMVDKPTVECDKEKDSTEKQSNKCNTEISSSHGGVFYPVYGGSYTSNSGAGNSGMGLHNSSSQTGNKSFSVTVPESTQTSHATTSRSVSSAKTSISRGGLGSSGRAFSSAAG